MAAVYISVLEHCRKRKVRTFLHLSLINQIFMLPWLSDLGYVVQIFIFGVVGSIVKV